jgi:hypothetical protein
MELVKTALNQNYFDFNNVIWHQESDRLMGFPISSILAEIILQHLDTNFYTKITRKNIQNITRYLDDDHDHI